MIGNIPFTFEHRINNSETSREHILSAPGAVYLFIYLGIRALSPRKGQKCDCHFLCANTEKVAKSTGDGCNLCNILLTHGYFLPPIIIVISLLMSLLLRQRCDVEKGKSCD
jgi:hypothetical protein